MNKGIQNEKMPIYGSTIGRSKYPCFLENNKRKMLPRPITKIRTGTLGYQLLKTCNWSQDIVKGMEKLCLKHLFNMKTSRSKNILRHVYGLIIMNHILHNTRWPLSAAYLIDHVLIDKVDSMAIILLWS